jgi:hypothetical protein
LAEGKVAVVGDTPAASRADVFVVMDLVVVVDDNVYDLEEEAVAVGLCLLLQ